jgi:hypothetical protein
MRSLEPYVSTRHRQREIGRIEGYVHKPHPCTIAGRGVGTAVQLWVDRMPAKFIPGGQQIQGQILSKRFHQDPTRNPLLDPEHDNTISGINQIPNGHNMLHILRTRDFVLGMGIIEVGFLIKGGK